MSGRFVIAISWPPSKKELNRISKIVSSKCKIVYPKTYSVEDFIIVAENADAIIGGYIPQPVIDAARKLKMVQVFHTGIAAARADEPDLGFSLSSLKERGILLGNANGSNSTAIAEHAFALLLVMAKRIFQSHHAVSSGEPMPRTSKNFSVELSGKTIGIIGLGHIGIEISKRAKAFNMRVIGVKRDPKKPTAESVDIDFIGSSADLLSVLKESDFVVVAVPLTKETEGLIGVRQLSSMKKSAYLINVSRAMIIDEKALKRALVENWIAGFGSDAWYPPSTGREQWVGGMSLHFAVPSWEGIHKLQNVVATAATAAYTRETIDNVFKVCFENVDMLARGLTPKYLVDIDRGY